MTRVHDKRCSKLSSYGLSGTWLSWIHAFFMPGLLEFVFGSCLSELCNVMSTVPQGRVLGPLSFLVFVNDIEQLFDKKILANCLQMMSDYILSKAIFWIVLSYKGFDDLANSSEKWQLKISVPQCQTLHLGRDSGQHGYFI